MPNCICRKITVKPHKNGNHVIAKLSTFMECCMVSLADSNKLKLSTNKTKIIIFHRPNVRLSLLPRESSELEMIDSFKLLGIFISATVNQSAY